jgi:hypothetical protein
MRIKVTQMNIIYTNHTTAKIRQLMRGHRETAGFIKEAAQKMGLVPTEFEIHLDETDIEVLTLTPMSLHDDERASVEKLVKANYRVLKQTRSISL